MYILCTFLSSRNHCDVFDECRDLYLDGNDLQCQGVVDLLHILVHQAVKDEADRQEEERIKAIEAIQAAQLGLIVLTIYLVNSSD